MFLFFSLAFLASWAAAYHFMLPKTLPEAHAQPNALGQPQTMQEILDTFKSGKPPQPVKQDIQHFSQAIMPEGIDVAATVKAFHIASIFLPLSFIAALIQLEEFAVLDQKILPLFMLPVFAGILIAIAAWRILIQVLISPDARDAVKKHFMTWGIIGWLSLGFIGSYLANFYLDSGSTHKVSGTITSIVCQYSCSTHKWWHIHKRAGRRMSKHAEYDETAFDCFSEEKRAEILQRKPGLLQKCTKTITPFTPLVFLQLDGEKLETLYSIDDETLIQLNGTRRVTMDVHSGYLGVPWIATHSMKAAY